MWMKAKTWGKSFVWKKTTCVRVNRAWDAVHFHKVSAPKIRKDKENFSSLRLLFAKKKKKKPSFMCLFKQLNTAALLYCRLSLIQHVAPQLLKRLHSWSEGGKSNYSAQPWWEKQSKDERKLDKQSKVDEGRRSISLFFPPAPRSWAGVLFLFVDCRALPQQQLLLLYPLLWSNPSPSCTVCLSDRYRSHSAAEAASGGGSATSLITETL